MKIRTLVAFSSLSLISIFSLGCNKTQQSNATSVTDSPSAGRGKTIYQTQCIACHNSDPRKPGSIGPEVYGASLELLEARILRAEYPSGYTPKRATKSMVPLPHLKNDLPSIHLYLNSPSK